MTLDRCGPGRSPLLKQRRDERGAAVTDFVMVSVLLMLVFVLTIQVGLALWTRNTLIAAAQEGARVAARADSSLAEGEALWPRPRPGSPGPRLCGVPVIGRLRPDRRHSGEQGSAVVEFVTLGVLLLVPLIYLVLTVARIQAGAYAVSMAAREAGRAFVTSGPMLLLTVNGQRITAP